MRLLCKVSAARAGRAQAVRTVKEHRTRERRELFHSEFLGEMARIVLRIPRVVPMDDDGRRAISVFLAVGGDFVTFLSILDTAVRLYDTVHTYGFTP